MAANINQVIKIISKQPLKIISNPWASVTSLIVVFGNLIVGSNLGDLIINQSQLSQTSLKLIILLLAIISFIYGIWREAQKYHIYTRQSLALPIVVNISNSASSTNAIKSIFQVVESESQDKEYQANLAKYLNIAQEDLIFEYKGDIFDRERLKDFLKITKYNLERLQNHTPGNTTFYLAYIGPISVAVLVGGLLGTYGTKIFQFNKSSDSYFPAVEISDRQLKENIIEFQNFDVLQPETKKHINAVVAIDISSHKLNLNGKEIVNYGDVIYLRSKNDSGTIDKNENWLGYSREIFKVLNDTQGIYQEIKLIYSMPVALGIVLGMAIQNYWNIVLTNYDHQTNSYQDLIKTNEITYYF